MIISVVIFSCQAHLICCSSQFCFCFCFNSLYKLFLFSYQYACFHLNGSSIVTLLKNLHNRLILLGIRMLSVQFQWSLQFSDVFFFNREYARTKKGQTNAHNPNAIYYISTINRWSWEFWWSWEIFHVLSTMLISTSSSHISLYLIHLKKNP